MDAGREMERSVRLFSETECLEFLDESPRQMSCLRSLLSGTGREPVNMKSRLYVTDEKESKKRCLSILFYVNYHRFSPVLWEAKVSEENHVLMESRWVCI